MFQQSAENASRCCSHSQWSRPTSQNGNPIFGLTDMASLQNLQKSLEVYRQGTFHQVVLPANDGLFVWSHLRRESTEFEIYDLNSKRSRPNKIFVSTTFHRAICRALANMYGTKASILRTGFQLVVKIWQAMCLGIQEALNWIFFHEIIDVVSCEIEKL